MKKYEKPAVLLNANVAEGIYMASGSGSRVIASGLTVTQDWKSGGIATCNVDLSGVNPNKLTVTFTFNANVADGWIDGGTQTVNGSTVSIYFYSAPSSATLNVRTDGVDINQLQIVDISSSN